MRGNSQVRFLGEEKAAMPFSYPTVLSTGIHAGDASETFADSKILGFWLREQKLKLLVIENRFLFLLFLNLFYSIMQHHYII